MPPPDDDLTIDPRRLDADAARALQRRLASRVQRRGQPEVTWVAAVDVAYCDASGTSHAAAVRYRLGGLEAEAEARVSLPTEGDYLPGLFSLRELPVAGAALDALGGPVDLLLVDGMGVAHPRRCGLASHLGLLRDLPTIGVGKSRLVGEHDEPAAPRGSRSPLIDGGETVGAVLRTQDGVAPLYVSVGHKISLEAACELVLACAPRYRQPEPIRGADHRCRAMRKAQLESTP